MVSSVPSDKAHQGWSGRYHWPPGRICTRPATADQDQQRTPMSLPRRARRTGARPDRRRGSQAASSNSSCRSIRAGAIGGARDGRPTPARYHEHRSPIGQVSDNLHRIPQLDTWVTRRLPALLIFPIFRPHYGKTRTRKPQPLPDAGPDRHLPARRLRRHREDARRGHPRRTAI